MIKYPNAGEIYPCFLLGWRWHHADPRTGAGIYSLPGGNYSDEHFLAYNSVDADDVKYRGSFKHDPDNWATLAMLLSLIPAATTLLFGAIGSYRQTDQWKKEANQLKEESQETASRSTWSGLKATWEGNGLDFSDKQVVDAMANLELSPLEFAWVVANGGLMHADALLRDAGLTNAAIRIKLLMACSDAFPKSDLDDGLLLQSAEFGF